VDTLGEVAADLAEKDFPEEGNYGVDLEGDRKAFQVDGDDDLH
jgi:hypothetical protein